MDRFTIRRVAALFAALGLTGMVGSYLNATDPFNAGYLVLVSGFVMVLTTLKGK